jgi:glycosyltransferase involved in cell wall biosynthesis
MNSCSTPERRRPKVAWISYFPVEWLPDAPESVRKLPHHHPATWQRVLLEEFRRKEDEERRGSGETLQPELHILCVRRQFERNLSFDLNAVTFHCLKLPPGMRTLTLFWWETLLIRRCLRKIRPDLVQAWGTERGAALVASRLRYPYLVTMQGLIEWYAERVRLARVQQLEARLERPSLRRASVVTTESRFAVQWLQQHYPHLEVRQAEHAANWMFHRLGRRPELQPMRFLCVAVQSRIKGTDILLQGLDRLREELDFRLTIVGPPAQQFIAEMKAVTSGALWERIEFKHELTQEQVAAEMERAAMVLFPTRVDTSPNSVKEAVVAGVPVVASAIGGIVDYVLAGKNGITFEAGNLEAFVKSVRAAVAHPLFRAGMVDDEIRKQMSNYLSPAVMRERFLSAYERVLERAAAGVGARGKKP